MAAKIMNSQEVLLSLKKLLNTLNCSTLDTEYLTYFTNKNAPKNSLPLVFPTQQDLTAPHFTQWDSSLQVLLVLAGVQKGPGL